MTRHRATRKTPGRRCLHAGEKVLMLPSAVAPSAGRCRIRWSEVFGLPGGLPLPEGKGDGKGFHRIALCVKKRFPLKGKVSGHKGNFAESFSDSRDPGKSPAFPPPALVEKDVTALPFCRKTR